MKITTMKKEQLLHLMKANKKAVKSKDDSLFGIIEYAEKTYKEAPNKVKKADLVDIVQTAMKVLGDKFVTVALAEEEAPTKEAPKEAPKKEAKPKAENSTKKLSKKGKKTEPQETPKEESEEKEAVKSAKKGTKKAPKKKDEGVIDLMTEADSSRAIQMAKAFPKTLSVGDTEYELAEDIKTMDDLYKSMENEEEIVFAYYWTKRHLKQFDYFGCFLGQPKSFTDDLDLTTAIYISDEKKVAYQVSMYTEAVYTILPKDFEEVDGVRLAGGIEYQIYRAK